MKPHPLLLFAVLLKVGALNPKEDSAADALRSITLNPEEETRSNQMRDSPRDVYADRKHVNTARLWSEAAQVKLAFNHVTPEEKVRAFNRHYGINQDITSDDVKHNRVKDTRIGGRRKKQQPSAKGKPQTQSLPPSLTTKRIKVHNADYFDDRQSGKAVHHLVDDADTNGAGIHPKAARTPPAHKTQVQTYLAPLNAMEESDEEYSGFSRSNKVEQADLDFALDVVEKEKQKQAPAKGAPLRFYLPEGGVTGGARRAAVTIPLMAFMGALVL